MRGLGCVFGVDGGFVPESLDGWRGMTCWALGLTSEGAHCGVTRQLLHRLIRRDHADHDAASQADRQHNPEIGTADSQTVSVAVISGLRLTEVTGDGQQQPGRAEVRSR